MFTGHDNFCCMPIFRANPSITSEQVIDDRHWKNPCMLAKIENVAEMSSVAESYPTGGFKIKNFLTWMREFSLTGLCPDYAHARASSVFSSKDNRTVILTRQDFFADRTADGDLLFTFLSNILDFLRSLSSYLKFGLRHEDSSRFYRKQGRLATRKSRSL